jgi:chitodextrinase
MHHFIDCPDRITASPRCPVKPAAPLNHKEARAFTTTSLSAAIKHVAVAIRVAAVALVLGVALPLAAQAADTTPPSVPAGLTVTLVTSTQINLAWNASTDNVGVKGYYVYLNNVPIAVTTKPSFQRTGLIPGTTYNFRVSAYDAVPNNSAWTAAPLAVKTTGAALPDTTPPSVPAGLTGSAVSNTQINLSWSASTDNVGVKGYYVYLNNVALTTTTATSFQHTGLTAGTTYNYRVSAFDAIPNHSAWTATPVAVTTTLITPPDTTPPSVPTNLTGSAVSNTQNNLTWSASTDNVGVKGYYVYLNNVALTTTTATSFQHTGLTAGTTYNYRVSAFDAVPNHSAWTATPVAVTTSASAAPVATPAPISAAAQFVATFPTNPFRTDTGDGVSNDNTWWVEQKAGTNRVTVVNVARDGGTGLRLHTEPGDSNVSGSGDHERNDISIPQATTGGYEGQEQWWAHSMLFPDDYALPPAGTWGVVFDFHDTRNQGGQANFDMFTGSDGRLSVRGHGGPDIVYDTVGNQYSYGADFGPIVRNVWYDFVYHVKWSSGSDGYIQAWVNGVLMLDHQGPTLYSGYGVFLKLANYHSAFGQPSSVIHDRVVRGPTALSVSPGPLQGSLVSVNGVLTAVTQ